MITLTGGLYKDNIVGCCNRYAKMNNDECTDSRKQN